MDLGAKPLGKSAPNYIEGPHRQAIRAIRKKYAEKIIKICSDMIY